MKGVSLYGIGYGKVHPENANGSHGEPGLSNWANTWCGLLDYIFYIEGDHNQDTRQKEPLNAFEGNNNVKIIGYLRMPCAQEMPKHSQPFEGEYASDHISLMCQIRLFFGGEKVHSLK